MKRLLVIVIGLLVAAVFSGWREHGTMVASFNEGCLEQGASAEQCQCGAEGMRDQIPFWRLSGMGSFRPFMSDINMDDVITTIGGACFAGTATG